MELIDRSAVPARDREQFWMALVFNVLIGNCDAHGKNYSLLYYSPAAEPEHADPLVAEIVSGIRRRAERFGSEGSAAGAAG